MGEALFAEKFLQNQRAVSVSSAGLGALVDKPADPLAQELMTQRGIDISTHRARQISSEIIFSSELILTMTSDQQEQVEFQYAGTRGRVHRLGKWDSYDVPDPYQRPRQIFEQALVLIEQGVDEWYRKLWK
jgi:protein-tyrosine phosphatase